MLSLVRFLYQCISPAPEALQPTLDCLALKRNPRARADRVCHQHACQTASKSPRIHTEKLVLCRWVVLCTCAQVQMRMHDARMYSAQRSLGCLYTQKYRHGGWSVSVACGVSPYLRMQNTQRLGSSQTAELTYFYSQPQPPVQLKLLVIGL